MPYALPNFLVALLNSDLRVRIFLIEVLASRNFFGSLEISYSGSVVPFRGCWKGPRLFNPPSLLSTRLSYQEFNRVCLLLHLFDHLPSPEGG